MYSVRCVFARSDCALSYSGLTVNVSFCGSSNVIDVNLSSKNVFCKEPMVNQILIQISLEVIIYNADIISPHLMLRISTNDLLTHTSLMCSPIRSEIRIGLVLSLLMTVSLVWRKTEPIRALRLKMEISPSCARAWMRSTQLYRLLHTPLK